MLEQCRLSDSAPLLRDNQQNSFREPPSGARSIRPLSNSAPILKKAQQNGFVVPNERVDGQSYEYNVGDDKSNFGDVSVFSSNVGKDEIESFSNGPGAVLVNILTSLRHLPPGMHSVLAVMALTWLSWFPFFLFDTDWMGREVYHVNPKGNADEVAAYQTGVRVGAFGLLLNSVALGLATPSPLPPPPEVAARALPPSLILGLERDSAWSKARPGARLGLERGSAWSEARPGARLGLKWRLNADATACSRIDSELLSRPRHQTRDKGNDVSTWACEAFSFHIRTEAPLHQRVGGR
ncbi:Sucrose transport protein SUT4 [Platanthera guangdongensis]|uniref:Sucrose transport protein SUT4 n=1 Tax=Platanthera guangdongensis TaxID=2320717 RepID=A0ABR2LXC4_9ASPA